MSKKEYFESVVSDLKLDTRDPFTLLFANACALLDQRDSLERDLARATAENEALRKTIANLQRDLANPPPDVQEAVLRKIAAIKEGS